MERKANYTLVGFLTLLLAVAMAVFVIWLGRFQFNRDFQLYDIKFPGPVNGLSQGGEARFNGIKVGEVSKVALDKRDASLVVARIRVGADVPIKTDSFATLEPQNITGVSYVQISAGTKGARLLKDVTPRGQVPILKSQQSTLSNLLEGGGTLLARAVEALDRVNRILSDKNITTLSATLSDVNIVTAEVRDQKQLFADARAAIQTIDRAADSITKTADGFTDVSKSAKGLIDDSGRKTLNDVSKAAQGVSAAANNVGDVVNSLKGPITEVSTNTLPQLTTAIISLQSAAESLEALANEIQSNPRALITKEPAKEIEVKP